jgi:hypothetical protein
VERSKSVFKKSKQASAVVVVAENSHKIEDEEEAFN